MRVLTAGNYVMTDGPSSQELVTGKKNSNLQVKQETGQTVSQDAFLAETAEMSLGQRFFSLRGIFQFVIMISILVGASFLMEELAKSKKERPQRALKEIVYTVDTQRAQAQDNQPVLEVFGDVVAGRSLNLTSLVPGEVIYVNPALRQGASIQKGDQLLKINPFSYQIARDEADANLKEAHAALLESKARLAMEKTAERRADEQFKLAQLDLERAENLLKSGSITKRVVEERELVFSQRQAAFQTAGANIAIQEAQIEARLAAIRRFEVALRNAEQQLRDTELKAPFNGIVQLMNVEVGQTVTATQSLFGLYEAETLDVRFLLSDEQYGRLSGNKNDLKGHGLDVYWTVGKKQSVFPAHIDRISAEISANRGGLSVFARLEIKAGQDIIRPGAFVKVRVPDQIFYRSFKLPESALYDGSLVYVVNDEKRLVARKVTVAVYDGQDVIITEGLKEGDEVLTTQLAEVGEGLLVRTNSPKDETRYQEKSAKAQSDKPRG